MTRIIERKYTFTEREIREALILALKHMNLQAPQYIGDTPTTKWVPGTDGSLTVTWSVEDDVGFPVAR